MPRTGVAPLQGAFPPAPNDEMSRTIFNGNQACCMCVLTVGAMHASVPGRTATSSLCPAPVTLVGLLPLRQQGKPQKRAEQSTLGPHAAAHSPIQELNRRNKGIGWLNFDCSPCTAGTVGAQSILVVPPGQCWHTWRSASTGERCCCQPAFFHSPSSPGLETIRCRVPAGVWARCPGIKHPQLGLGVKAAGPQHQLCNPAPNTRRPQGRVVRVLCNGDGEDTAIIQLVKPQTGQARMPVSKIVPHLLPLSTCLAGGAGC